MQVSIAEPSVKAVGVEAQRPQRKRLGPHLESHADLRAEGALGFRAQPHWCQPSSLFCELMQHRGLTGALGCRLSRPGASPLGPFRGAEVPRCGPNGGGRCAQLPRHQPVVFFSAASAALRAKRGAGAKLSLPGASPSDPILRPHAALMGIGCRFSCPSVSTSGLFCGPMQR